MTGFQEINPKEKEINSLTQTSFYLTEMMSRQAHRMEFEFEKECINEMARSTLRKHLSTFTGSQDMAQSYRISVKIGHGFTYSKYNTLMHFLNVAECYWQNPDLNSIQVLCAPCGCQQLILGFAGVWQGYSHIACYLLPKDFL